jgi:hypothetical protein
MPANPNRISAFKPTRDQWYPSYKLDGCYEGGPLMLVEVTLHGLGDSAWRISVWGADDFGMELELPGATYESALSRFLGLIGRPTVDVADLAKDGFVNA